jgi:hypothetical protein
LTFIYRRSEHTQSQAITREDVSGQQHRDRLSNSCHVLIHDSDTDQSHSGGKGVDLKHTATLSSMTGKKTLTYTSTQSFQGTSLELSAEPLDIIIHKRKPLHTPLG